MPQASRLGAEDRRRIQTAVLGSAHSQVPVVLPTEAMELTQFRRARTDATFWCGVWLGGCGRQLHTKLYVDRACHFAHHGDETPSEAACARRARDVTSADHLYVRAAAEQLLQAQSLSGAAVCSPPGAAPAGSLVHLHLGEQRALTIHMNSAVPPNWDSPEAAGHTVLEAGVPVSRRAVERLRYIHRIRLEPEGTTRKVLIGTQTVHGTSWFRPEQCAIGPAGLLTPALRDLPERSAAVSPSPPQGENRPAARVSEEVRRLLLRLASARRSRDMITTRTLITECDDILRRRGPAQPLVKQARDAAEEWLRERGQEVVKRGRGGKVEILSGYAAAQEREARALRARQAAQQRQGYLAELALALQHERFGDVRALLRAIGQLNVAKALSADQSDLLNDARARTYGTKAGALQDQVSRKKWIRHQCPTCGATSGEECFDELPGQPRTRRPGGHDERLLLIVAARGKARASSEGPASPDASRTVS